MTVTFPKQRIEERPGIAVLSGPKDQLDTVEAALLARGFRAAPERDLRNRHAHGLPSYPTSAVADQEGAPNAGHTPGTKHPRTGRKYKADESITFLTIPLLERTGRGRAVDDVASAIDPGSGWRLRLHSARSLHTVNVRDPDGQVIALRMELDAMRRHLGLPPFMGGGAPENPAYTLQNGGGHPAELFRRAISTLIGSAGGGAIPGSLGLAQNGSPNMSVNVAGGSGYGEVWIPGTSVPGQQGIYYCYNDSTQNLSIVASDPSDPRIDTVIAQVEDSTYIGSGDLWQLAVLTGTPTPGATLGNLDGIASLPVSSLTDGYVLVGAGVGSILNADLQDELAPFAMSPGFRSGVASIEGFATVAPQQTTYLDTQTLVGPDIVIARGPLFTIGASEAQVIGATTGWYTDSGHTTPAATGGWVEYFATANGVYGTYSNPVSGTLYVRSRVTAIGV